MESFLVRGVGGTTVDQIRESSGASVGSFYHHFASKVDVAATLYLETLGAYQAEFARELLSHDDPRTGIESVVRQHLRWVGRNPRLASYLTHCREPEVVAASEIRVQELNQSFFASVVGWLQRFSERGAIRVLPADLYYALWMGPAEVFTRLRLASGHSRAALAEAQRLLPPAAWEALRATKRTRP